MTTDQEVYRPLPEIVAAANVKTNSGWTNLLTSGILSPLKLARLIQEGPVG
jgi:O-phosphoseryl-tRNA(Cys) synthetase